MNVTNHIVEAGFCQCKRMRGAGVRCHIPRLRFYANKQCYESPTSGDQVQRLYHEVWLQLSSQCRFLFFMIMDIPLRTHPVFPLCKRAKPDLHLLPNFYSFAANLYWIFALRMPGYIAITRLR